ncbi:MAG: 3-dehydroquinate synthase, partial [Clostridia bacterium]|nr:3-dehydroquinate synthase [Clostridia bacterium]
MKTITINASKKYDIFISDNILSQTGELILKISTPKTVAIITDDIVDELYSAVVENSLKKSSLKHIKFVIKNGEQSKNGQNFLKICEFLAENQITRSDMIIALGGGVVGDLAGFVASAYLRGINFIQIPTTLLSCVDSSVGGKTAIDIESGKNLVGAFYQPRLVICDYSTLDTLSDEIFSQGCAEVIKYAVIGNCELFSHLQRRKKDFDREYVISECVKMKRDIVQRDE